MATENKSKQTTNNKKRKNYLPYNKSVKKGSYPLRPGVQGFFITCDGGREHQASNEAINVIDSFYEEIVEGTELKDDKTEIPQKPTNKIIKFTDSDSSGSDDDGDNDEKDADEDGGNVEAKEDKDKLVISQAVGESKDSGPQNEDDKNEDDKTVEKKTQENDEKPENDSEAFIVPPAKKQCVETIVTEVENGLSKKIEEKSVDKLIEDEIAALKDKSKRRFSKLDPGCNGLVFIQMSKRDGDPTPKDIVQHMMTSLSKSKKHVSRFLLRVLPVEITCYASDEEIKKAIKPLIEKYFSEETQTPHKFAVLYEARANTGIDRMKIIDAVATSVPAPHKVDLSNPDLTIVVQIVKTVCLIGVAEKYKELAKYNLRQLTNQ